MTLDEQLIQTIQPVRQNGETAVLCRTNRDVYKAYQALKDAGIPAKRCDNSVKMQAKLFRLQVSALRLLVNNHNNIACKWVYRYYYPNDLLTLKKCELEAIHKDKTLLDVLITTIPWFKIFTKTDKYKYAFDAVMEFLGELPSMGVDSSAVKQLGITDTCNKALRQMAVDEPHILLKDFLVNLSLRSVQDELKRSGKEVAVGSSSGSSSSKDREGAVGSGGDDREALVMTVHASKGLEFDNVIIYNMTRGNFPIIRKNTDTEEERRIFYVALTRTIERCIVLTVEGKESEYLGEIGN